MTNPKNPGSLERAVSGEPPMIKSPQPDDPMQMGAEFVEGDPRVMLTCLIEEYARMGWDAGRIARIFDNPFFLASHGLAERFGRDAIHTIIEQTLRRCGVYHFEVIEQTPNQPGPSTALPDAGEGSSSDFRRRS